MDDDIELFGSDAHRACRAYSDPIFLQDYLLSHGHTEETTNATATFVRFRGRVYACTCRHVRDAIGDPAVVQGAHPGAALMAGRIVFNLSFHSAEGLTTSLRAPGEGGHQADVCVAPLPEHNWLYLVEKKGKAAIDLDRWEAPPWDRVGDCFAAGYPTHHKAADGEFVSITMLGLGAAIASKLSPECREFTLSSALDAPHGYFFSGCSGGPILALWDGRFRPVGLITEGAPSAPDKPSAWAGPNDIFVRGLLLTPERFAEWLERLE